MCPNAIIGQCYQPKVAYGQYKMVQARIMPLHILNVLKQHALSCTYMYLLT